MKDIIDNLKDKGLTISLAESMTGGKLAYEFTKHPGASKVFLGSIVAYSNEMKINVLNINESLIKKYTTVSNEIVLSMVKGLKESVKSDIYIAVTGNAGPSFEENTNELICYVKILYNNEVFSGVFEFDTNNRENNINDTIELIKDMIENYILL